MTVCSCANEFTLTQEYPDVPAGMPFKRYIQKWYDERFRWNDCIVIKIYGAVWCCEKDVMEVTVVYDMADYDDGSEDKGMMLEFKARRRSPLSTVDFRESYGGCADSDDDYDE